MVTETDHRGFNPLHNGDLERKAAEVRKLYSLADEIVVTTPVLGEFIALESPAGTRITVIPDALEPPESLYPQDWLRQLLSFRDLRPRWELDQLRLQLAGARRKGAVNLVWFGGHGTGRGEAGGMLDLSKIQHVVETLGRLQPITLSVISNNRNKFNEVVAKFALPTFYLDWNRLTFHDALRLHQVCVLPICESPWTLCKSNNRLVTALDAGLLCAADEIPSYKEFSDFAHIGPIEDSLGRILHNFADLQFKVPAVREKVRRIWCMDKVGEQWEDLVLRNIATVS